MTEFTQNSTAVKGLDGGFLSSGMGGASDVLSIAV